MPTSLRRSLLLLALLPTGCGLISFDVSTPLPASTISQGASGTPLTELEQPVTVNKLDTGPADSATLKSLTFTATNGQTFDFVQDIHLFLSSPDLPDVEVANLLSVPTGQTSITLDALPNVQLLPYLQAGFTLHSTVDGTEPAQDFTFSGELVVHVGV